LEKGKNRRERTQHGQEGVWPKDRKREKGKVGGNRQKKKREEREEAGRRRGRGEEKSNWGLTWAREGKLTENATGWKMGGESSQTTRNSKGRFETEKSRNYKGRLLREQGVKAQTMGQRQVKDTNHSKKGKKRGGGRATKVKA